MSDQTPAQKLDDAIHEYIAATNSDDDSSTLTHWILGFEKTALDPGDQTDPLISLPGYIVGPGVTIITAVGLARVLQRQFDMIADEHLFEEE